MKNKTNNLISLLLIMGALGFFVNSCKKDELPELTTIAITDITHGTAKSGGNITSDGGAEVIARGVCWSTHETPTISDNKTTDDIGVGSFVSTISGLSVNTTYYVRAYATNSTGTGYGNTLSFSSTSIFTDTRDGRRYSLVTIGEQTWIAENLKYLPSVVGPGTGSRTTPYYYVYDYDGTSVAEAKATDNFRDYGVLYNWPAAMNGASSSTTNPSRVQGVCPDGWHLPSDAEWTELIDFLGGDSVAGDKLKSIIFCYCPHDSSTNESGFWALPGGSRGWDGLFGYEGSYGYWWSTTEYNTYLAWSRSVRSSYSGVKRTEEVKEEGLSVRCVRD